MRGEQPPEVTVRLSFAPGEASQVDFGASPMLTHPDGRVRRTWAFVMTLCHCRHQYVEFEDLAKKTHRGLVGQALAGYSAGGLPYGYRSVQESSGHRRQVNEQEAPWVRFVFERYDAGASARVRCVGGGRQEFAMDIVQQHLFDPQPWHFHPVRARRRSTISVAGTPIAIPINDDVRAATRAAAQQAAEQVLRAAPAAVPRRLATPFSLSSCATFEAEARRLLKEAKPDASDAKRALKAARLEVENILAAIRAGIITASTKAALLSAEEREREAQAELEAIDRFAPTQLLPRAREIYQDLVGRLETIDDVNSAREALRQLLGEIRLVPQGAELYAETTSAGLAGACQLSVVAGAGFEPTTFGL